MSSDLHQIILDELGKWIELIQNPACELEDRVEFLKVIRGKITSDPDSVSLLIDGNIWGGMGSFVDSAMLNIFYYKPTTTDPKQRAEQWEMARRKCHSWQHEFNLATIELGEAIVEFCPARTEMDAGLKRSMEWWISFAKMSIERPEEPLQQVNIDVLESNLRREFE